MMWVAYVQMTEVRRLNMDIMAKSIGYQNYTTTLWMITVRSRERCMSLWTDIGTATNIFRSGIVSSVRTVSLG